jgi:hypothetical protein
MGRLSWKIVAMILKSWSYYLVGAFTFLFVIVVRYNDKSHAPMIVELQIGQIDSTEHSMGLLRPLLDDMLLGLKKLMPSRDEKSTVGVLNDDYEL